MPVEIKELIIRAVVKAEDESSEAPALRDTTQDQDAIIQECVRQVLRILKKMKER
jgi:hypothetical protein